MTARSSLLSVAIRFGIAGALNTALTLAVYQASLFFLSPSASYAVSWVAGLSFVALFYPTKVFDATQQRIAGSAATAGVYLVSFGAGLLIINLGSALGLERLAVFVAMALTTTFNFLLSKVALSWIGSRSNDH